jgi:uncharacterized protein YejL (UPF0352 family)
MDDDGLLAIIRQKIEKEILEEKNERVARIHNAIIDILAKEKAHVDEIIIALEVLLQETLNEKIAQVQLESKIAVEQLPQGK